jgi:hypothetical protein
MTLKITIIPTAIPALAPPESPECREGAGVCIDNGWLDCVGMEDDSVLPVVWRLLIEAREEEADAAALETTDAADAVAAAAAP